MATLFGRCALQVVSQSGYQGVESSFLELSACFVTAAYFDTNGNPWQPAAVSYRVDDVLSGKNIVPFTAIQPGTTNQVTITSAQNSLISLTRCWEVHEVTFQITDANGNESLAAVWFDLVRVAP